jgi:hypothetical protein
MADGSSRKVRTILVEYSFDRLQGSKLQQAYELLVPHYVRAMTGRSPKLTEDHDESGRDLREGVVEQTERREHDFEPNRGTACICTRTKLQRSG